MQKDVRDAGSITGLGRSPGGGNGNPLQYSYRDNPMDRGAWQTAVYGITELDMTEATEHEFTIHNKVELLEKSAGESCGLCISSYCKE